MAFRKQLPAKPVPTVREMVTKYGDDWYLYSVSHAISSPVWSGDRRRGDYSDAWVMKRCETGERDRIDPWDVRDAGEDAP